MLQLENGCTCSVPTVTPANWKTGGNSLLKREWFIQYYFRDPQFAEKYKYGKQIRVKGMNEFPSLEDRRKSTEQLLKLELDKLQNQGYNPITKVKLIEEIRTDYEIAPETPWLVAIDQAYKRLKIKSVDNLKSTVKIVGMAARELQYGNLAVKDVRRKHIKIILDHLQKTRPQPAAPARNGKPAKKATTWGPASYNHFRSHLISIFNELLELEAIEDHPVISLKKQEETPQKKKLLTTEELQTISKFLFANYYTFWRYVMMFFYSGSRNTELLLVKAENVDLENQTFKIDVLKGRKKRETTRAIMDEALPLWREILKDAKASDYIFSVGLRPGATSIRPEQIKRRWTEHVQGKLKINKTPYALKYILADLIAAQLGLEAAAMHDGHTSTAMVKKIYAQGHEERERKKIQKLPIKFGNA
jgi:integrase